jgi:type VI secretion system secreted protein VgrG
MVERARTPTLQASFDSTALNGTRVSILTLVCRDAVSEPYEARLTLGVEDPDFDSSLLLGAPATVTLARGSGLRQIHGIVREVSEPHPQKDEVTRFEAVLVPALWLLSLRRNTRMFQNQTVPEIVEAVLEEGLGPYDRTFSNHLAATYTEREYCLQYQESDLAFVQRLLEEEGIGYSFDHGGDEAEDLALWDASPDATELPGPQRFEPTGRAAVSSDDAVTTFHLAHRTTTTSVVARDWDWTRAGDTAVEAEVRSEDALGRDRESYEFGQGRSLSLAEYSAPAYGADDATHQARVRKEAAVCEQLRARGRSQAVVLNAGAIFDLSGHPSQDGRYFLTRVEHRLGRSEGGVDADWSYANHFECVPADVPWRPGRRTPKPRIPGIQTATVTGPGGEEIHVDEHGRIKVQFAWDRDNPSDDTSSCWVRVEQPWAGAGWGHWFVPRIGMEVVVMFIDGDPDRPLVTGSVYNGANLLPYVLPDEKTKSTIMTQSSPGGGGFNELRFEDRAGSEEIFTHAQKDYDEVILNDHNTRSATIRPTRSTSTRPRRCTAIRPNRSMATRT